MLGKDQAKAAHDAWKRECDFDIPLPEKLYSSPLTRAIHTNKITFDSIIPKSQRTMIIEVSGFNNLSLGSLTRATEP
jgi:broad specificity phosphatase PhoE